MRYYRFRTQSDITTRPDQFVITEADGTHWIYCQLDSEEHAKRLAESHGYDTWEPVDLKQYVDWGVQWTAHTPDFKDYELKIDLTQYSQDASKGRVLRLAAGPGFGDLSHPTTRLSLALLGEIAKGRPIVDIGCGSGILSLAAGLLGASSVVGIDIDPEAIQHAEQNAQLNGLTDRVHFLLSENYHATPVEGSVIVMNMITSQQRQVWTAYPQLHHAHVTWITSGMLVSERDKYLQECHQRGWNVIEERRDGDWMAIKAV